MSALLKNTLGEEGESWFEVIAAGDIVPAKKPAPDIYTYAMQAMNISADNCIAFEDSENGIRSSSAANLKTIITTNDYTKSHDFNGAAIVLDCFGEPDQPFNVIIGDAGSKTYVDIEFVNTLFERN